MHVSGRYRAMLGLVSLIAILAITACSGTTTGTGGSGTSTGATTVVEKNFAFNPANLSVKVGDVVTFSNQDNVAHHVVVGTTDLGVQQPGKDVMWTASKDGVIPVKCLIHPSMLGQITVGTGGGSTSTPATGTAPSPPAGSSGY